jgi:hypothetical protein
LSILGRLRGKECGSIGLIVLLALAGCTQAAAETPQAVSPVPTSYPASAAGDACQLLDYDVIQKAIGVRFDVAAASRQGGTHTCVVQASDANHPDLVLTVSTATADAALFRSTLVPKTAKAVKGLGVAAYQVTIGASQGQGPGVEVGWLSGDNRLITLRFTFAAGADQAAVAALPGKLVELAKKVDLTSV